MGKVDKLLTETLLFIAQKGWTINEHAFYDSLSLFLAKKLNVAYVIIDKLLPEENAAETLSFVAFDEVKSNAFYPLKNTPCENVMGRNLCCYVRNIQALFPDDAMLVDMMAESYIGIPLWDTKGKPIGLIALLDTKPIDNAAKIKTILQILAVRVAHEIERNNYDQTLIEKNKKLHEADRLKSAFLANMSHEIRTPLNSIVGFSELIADSDFDEAQKNFFIQQIITNGNNLLTIISDIMDISMLESGELKICKKLINVQNFISNIEKQFAYLTKAKGLEFRVTYQDNDEIVINADEDRLRQILNNLINNATKFTISGGLEIGYKQEYNFVKFYVIDSGIGIQAEYHDKIFDRFRQVEDANTRKYGGNGLGLAITRNLVELMGGRIWVESVLGKGSTFYFTLPVIK
ncbi:MAG: ATP-binding protein [Prolixibacteraceae bacterium]